MQVRYKLIEHGVKNQAPFVGTMVCAGDVADRHKEYKSKIRLSKLATESKEAIEIINEILSDRRNEGIILSNLEWSDQIEEMFELVSLASKHGLKIMITTCLNLMEFYAKLGKYAYEHESGQIKYEEKDAWFFDGMYEAIGSTVLDYYTPDGYFLKYGEYKRDFQLFNDTKEPKIVFGVQMDSINQGIAEIRGDKEIDFEHSN